MFTTTLYFFAGLFDARFYPLSITILGPAFGVKTRLGFSSFGSGMQGDRADA
jgi:hypothetical protein